ncbi:MAG: hypothetical protein N2V78_12075 [Methanophagales archaeon]|nr:hypothetical protein [Methanophagales archaeon]
MLLTPAFEIGLWNAWIFMFYHQLLCIILLGSKGLLIKSSAATPHKNIRKKIVTFLGLIYYLALIFSFFLPLKLGTMWFYIGLPIGLSGLIMYTIVTVNFATTPPDEPVTKGAVSLFTKSAVSSLLSFASSEERFCLEKYGDAYREYMNKTPEYIRIGIPKLKR